VRVHRQSEDPSKADGTKNRGDCDFLMGGKDASKVVIEYCP